MHASAWNLERVGWQNDTEKIKSTFKSMNYNYKIILNCKKAKILNNLKKLCYTSEGKNQLKYTMEVFLGVLNFQDQVD
jgi:hypothetical protein